MAEKVLVVDDERDIADLLEVYLRNENYDVYKYYSAKEALECIENQEIDLAILDIMLPDINGFSLCQKIREKYTYPIIMLTAKDEETDKITGLTLGADDYVTIVNLHGGEITAQSQAEEITFTVTLPLSNKS